MKLKSYVVNIILFINVMCIMLLTCECDDLYLFVISKLILLGIFLLNNYILYKYSDIFEY